MVSKACVEGVFQIEKLQYILYSKELFYLLHIIHAFAVDKNKSSAINP